ncbi:MAG TPA: BACON domain-containing carbohydrate-binding protein [Vicinamibacterales bacterium]|nr:BACON domain-containing carbohydrate-binding protein [Vicinamibacterales bacterium]
MRRLTTAGAAALLLSSAACGSSAKTSVGPSAFEKCSVEASAAPTSFPPEGGDGRLTISTEAECAWSATSAAAWISLTSGSGQGATTVNFRVAANPDPAARSSSVTVGAREVSVTQQAAPCRYRLSASAVSLPSAGGSIGIDVTPTSGQCEWRARSATDWVVIREGATGRGNGRVVIEAGPSAGPPRTATIVIADLPVTLTQGDGCAHTISPGSQDLPASGGTGTVQVSTGQGCAWSAMSQASWITITSGANGSGSGSVTFSVPTSDGPMRTGTLSVAGHTFTVTQASGCTFSIDRSGASVPAAGQVVDVLVTSGAGCTWNATSNAEWISIQSGATGSGTGQVRLQVGASSGPERSGTATIAGRPFTVTQGSGCTFALTSSTALIPAAGGPEDVGVVTAAGCAWTIWPDPAAPWLHITSPPNRSGEGRVTFYADPNPGPPRSATFTVAGHSFRVDQAGGCSYSISPTDQLFDVSGGTGTIQVTTSGGCGWQASNAPEWITITSGTTGNGPGAVTFSVSANPGPGRSAMLSVAGHMFTVTQTGTMVAILR